MTWQGRLPEPDSTKQQRFFAVAEAVAGIVTHGGVSKVTISSVARRARVSRAWIYKYLGDDPATLLSHAARVYAEAFSDLARSRKAPDVASWRALVATATRDGLHDTLLAPWCVQLYFRHRHSNDPIGQTIRDVEQRYLDVFVADLPPALRDPSAACFAELFLMARLGMYHRWLDPAARARFSEDAVVTELLAPLDAWITRVATR